MSRMTLEKQAERMMMIAKDLRHALDVGESTGKVFRRNSPGRRDFAEKLKQFPEAHKVIFGDGIYSETILVPRGAYGNVRRYNLDEKIKTVKLVRQQMLGGLCFSKACWNIGMHSTVVSNWIATDTGIQNIIEGDGTYTVVPKDRHDIRSMQGNSWKWAASKLREGKCVQRIGQTIRRYRFDGKQLIEVRRDLKTRKWDIEEVAILTTYDLKAMDWVEANG